MLLLPLQISLLFTIGWKLFPAAETSYPTAPQPAVHFPHNKPGNQLRVWQRMLTSENSLQTNLYNGSDVLLEVQFCVREEVVSAKSSDTWFACKQCSSFCKECPCACAGRGDRAVTQGASWENQQGNRELERERVWTKDKGWAKCLQSHQNQAAPQDSSQALIQAGKA